MILNFYFYPPLIDLIVVALDTGQALMLVYQSEERGETTHSEDQSYAGSVFMRIITFSPVTAQSALPPSETVHILDLDLDWAGVEREDRRLMK